jgi:hypothetical protein
MTFLIRQELLGAWGISTFSNDFKLCLRLCLDMSDSNSQQDDVSLHPEHHGTPLRAPEL